MKKLLNILLLIGFLIGLGIFAYPTLSNWLAKYNQIQAVQSYNRYVTGMSLEQIENEWRRAEEYNQLVREGPVTDPFADIDYVEPFTEYNTILDIDGIMGYLEIPVIDVKTPIYHGVSEEVLKKGVGHIKATALPVGGEGTHAVLSAHSGLPEAKLFTELEKVKEGDYFFLYILEEKLAYRVDQISIVEPDDISHLISEAGKDYVTLVTCTPIGINSHRLLVRGERCEVPAEDVPAPSKEFHFIWIVCLILTVILFIIIIILKRRKRKRQLESNKF